MLHIHRWHMQVGAVAVFCALTCGCARSGDHRWPTAKPIISVQALSCDCARSFEQIQRIPPARMSAVHESGLSWNYDGSLIAFPCTDPSGRWSISVSDLSKIYRVARGLPRMARPAMGKGKGLIWWTEDRAVYLANIEHPTVATSEGLPFPVGDLQMSPQQCIAACTVLAIPGPRFAMCSASTKGPAIVGNVDIPVVTLQWSPDGQQVALLRFTTAEEARSRQPQDHLYVYDIKRKELALLVSDRQVLLHSWGWTDRGRSICFAERRPFSPVASRLWKVDVRTGMQYLLADLAGMGSDVQAVRPSPDGSAFLLVVRKVKAQRKLVLLDISKRKCWMIAEGNLWMPAWSPRGDAFAVAVNGNLWLVTRNGLNARCLSPAS